MEVKPGYKLTEVGIIPEDWEVKPLKEISPQQSVGLVINPSTYFDKAGTVPMLVGSNIGENTIDWASAKRITEDSNQKLPASRLCAGDLVMVRVGDPGTTAVIPSEFDGCNCASMMIVRKHPSFNSEWLCFMMNSPLGRTQVAGVQYGTAQKQFNISDAINFRYPVPPPPEQRSIATALADMDALLVGLDQLIAKKRDLKQATMQQLLTGKKRLPRLGEGKGYKLTEVGVIPEDWNVFVIEELGTVIRGASPRPKGDKRYYGGEVPRLMVEDVTRDGKFVTPSVDFLTEEGERRSRPCPKGTLTLVCSGTVGIPSFLAIDACIHDGFLALINIKNKVDGDFLYHFLKTQQSRFDNSATHGGVFTNLTTEIFKNFKVPLPMHVEEQHAIATVLSDMDAEIAAIEERRDKTRALKQGMMQELLTGRTRLL